MFYPRIITGFIFLTLVSVVSQSAYASALCSPDEGSCIVMNTSKHLQPIRSDFSLGLPTEDPEPNLHTLPFVGSELGTKRVRLGAHISSRTINEEAEEAHRAHEQERTQ